ncbi:MAG TPA: hypothetical protein VKZ81_11620 [Pseudonocardia sp.]|uniref:hypothetical protein n=1 Tax=Pseudonocardia sp. TaxID=60912 RepID=UPI002B4ADBBE|nr:hypothetical protein [Pseudonocardia sp.]HLU56101.1 hypothetical protein [Pseudonocardia sp.]
MTGIDTTPSSRRSRAVGHAFAVAGDAALLVAVNVWPGWAALPFLTQDFVRVLTLVNLAVAVGVAVNFVCLVVDRPLLRAVGEVVTTALGLAAMVRLVRVFPFAFPASGVDWALVVRAVLVLGIVGSTLALLVAVASAIRLAIRLMAGRAR